MSRLKITSVAITSVIETVHGDLNCSSRTVNGVIERQFRHRVANFGRLCGENKL